MPNLTAVKLSNTRQDITNKGRLTDSELETIKEEIEAQHSNTTQDDQDTTLIAIPTEDPIDELENTEGANNNPDTSHLPTHKN